MAPEAGSSGISGSLRDVSVADVLQFIHIGRRTGTLDLVRAGEKARIGFHAGSLVSAESPGTPRLGEVLVERRLITRRQLDAAMVVQSHATEPRSLGQILVSTGAMPADTLRTVVEEKIRHAVGEVLLWDSGTFEFTAGDPTAAAEVLLHPREVLPDAALNTQMVLLEASRIFDERSRRGVMPAAPSPAGPGAQPGSEAHADAASFDFAGASQELHDAVSLLDDAAPRHGSGALELQVVSADETLLGALRQTFSGSFAAVGRVRVEQAGITAIGAPPPVVVVDMRAGGVVFATVAAIHRARPRASLVAVADRGEVSAQAYAAGALAVVPAEPVAVVACVERVLENRHDLHPSGRPVDDEPGVARLRRALGDLRSGSMSATMALSLMHTVSESVERAVLFLVRRDQFATLGAFGADGLGRHLAALTRGLRLPLGSGDALSRAVHGGEVLSVSFEQADLPEPLGAILGRPRTGQVVIFPVVGAQRVIAAIYADNGSRDEPIRDLDILELATAQAGIAFENELLRRQIAGR